MVFVCPPGTTKMFRFKRTRKGLFRLGGCGKKGRFIKNGVKETKKMSKGGKK